MNRETIRGYALGEVVSALQKAIRRGQVKEAAWWAAELEQSGHGAHCWNRMVVITSEDVGLAWPEGPSVIRALKASYDEAAARRNPSRPERLFIIHAAVALAHAPKSRWVDHAVWASFGYDDQQHPIPDEALDLHTARGRQMGRGEDHWFKHAAVLVGEAELGDDPFFEKMKVSSEEAFARQWSAGRAAQPPTAQQGMFEA